MTPEKEIRTVALMQAIKAVSDYAEEENRHVWAGAALSEAIERIRKLKDSDDVE